MPVRKTDIELLKCLFEHGIWGKHHWTIPTIQRACHRRMRKGLRQKLQRLVNEGYLWTKAMRHFAVTQRGKDFLIETGEVEYP